MSFTIPELDQAQSDLKAEGCDISGFRRFAEIIPRISDMNLEETIAQFHNWAARLPYWKDRDIGALVLEHVADAMTSNPRRAALYRHAAYRASWYAASATAVAEGILRSKHTQQIKKKLAAEPAPRASL
jgi:hypothetical protein